MSSDSTVRVRFAPSPTGFFHIGGARTALFNWLYARKTGGVLILRIEDTDAERNQPEFLQLIYDSLRWLGLDWDEGPEVGGDYGPYFQSQRGEIYKRYRDQLVASGHAYENDGATWFKVSGQPQVIQDAIRGRVERLEEKDFVIYRSNGSPTFHFVNVVDDIEMRVTHVIRGEDHLSNTSKHTELFDAIGAPRPIYAHIPLILKSDGPGKMSKRDRGALVEEYQQRHFLASALRNYLCLLGWSPKNDREVMPLEEIIEAFDLPGINKNNARFDEKKASHMNTQYLRAMPPETFAWLAKPILVQAGVVAEDVDENRLQEALAICQEKARSLEELPGFVGYFFREDFPVDPVAKAKVFGKGDPLVRLQEFRAGLDRLTEWTEAALEAYVVGLGTTHGKGTGEYIHPVRLAVSGTNVGPGFYSLLRVLGRERVTARVDQFLATA